MVFIKRAYSFLFSMLCNIYDKSLRLGFRDGSFDNKPKINKELKKITQV